MLRQIVLREPASARWLFFNQPLDVLVARSPSEVQSVLARAERRVNEEDLYAAGFVTYEAAGAFDDAFVTQTEGPLPLICVGLFRAPEAVSQLQFPATTASLPLAWKMGQPRDVYLEKIAAIKKEIARGNTYQVNYTVRQHCDKVADAWQLFLDVAADAPYAAYIECGDHSIVSASPELFFELNGEKLICKPMKGTAPRGMTLQDDREIRQKLRESAKDRAENVMIADMVRNDLGRIALPGTVQTPALFDVEKYRTVWQMTSTVTAATRSPVAEIFRALFPCASVTGAPKVASMKFIADLEDSPREIYTGAIGFLAPGRQARFSVAIRTAQVDNKTGKAIYGVGGGIVWDSDPEDEYRECLDKARVLSTPAFNDEFELLETMLWTPGDGYFLRDEHLQRLSDSAAYFDFAYERRTVEQRLDALSKQLPDKHYRIRLALSRDGGVKIEKRLLATAGNSGIFRTRLAEHPIDAGNPFLYHKTTLRSVYEDALSTAGDCDDVLLWNGDREVTESTIANVVIRKGNRLVTPPVECGLLAGTYRRKLLRDGKITEGKLSLADLDHADEIFLINSVRRWIDCRLVRQSTPPLSAVRSDP